MTRGLDPILALLSVAFFCAGCPTDSGRVPVPVRASPAPAGVAPSESESAWLPPQTLLQVTTRGPRGGEAFRTIRANWRDAYAVALVEQMTLAPAGARPPLLALLQRGTGAQIGMDPEAWYRWIWSRAPETYPHYGAFKAALYGRIDPSFRRYFGPSARRIRLDEVRWGGVHRDGIPPLRQPAVETAAQATWLADSDVVFGVSIDGAARAYPKRILAWHEMVVDTLGKVPITGVYCTLCGAMIVYESAANGVVHRLGTSGFLYRSNKLMYDDATRSLWSTLEGVPVIGSLVGQGIRLRTRSCVTTTWGEWRRRHPTTTTLSLQTGHRRDYGEGVAYADYFSTDALMFGVPSTDQRLRNKAEVLALRFGALAAARTAIHSAWLAKRPIYTGLQGGVPYVVLTDRSGAHRVYRRPPTPLKTWDRDRFATDAAGGRWEVGEDALIGPNGARAQRLPAHRSFWFGWRAAYPNTRLVGG